MGIFEEKSGVEKCNDQRKVDPRYKRSRLEHGRLELHRQRSSKERYNVEEGKRKNTENVENGFQSKNHEKDRVLKWPTLCR